MLVLNRKRGVSPLIATILLIAFAVALGAVVMQLGAGLGAESCSSDLQLSIKGFPCFDGKNVRLGLKNSGNFAIEGTSVWIYGSKEGIKTKNIEEIIAQGSSINIDVDYDFNLYGTIANIDVIPKFKKDEESVSCNAAKIQITEISDC